MHYAYRRVEPVRESGVPENAPASTSGGTVAPVAAAAAVAVPPARRELVKRVCMAEYIEAPPKPLAVQRIEPAVQQQSAPPSNAGPSVSSIAAMGEQSPEETEEEIVIVPEDEEEVRVYSSSTFRCVLLSRPA